MLTLRSPKLLDYCKAKGIHATAYSCLGSTDSPLYKDESLKKLADSKGKTVQQVLYGCHVLVRLLVCANHFQTPVGSPAWNERHSQVRDRQPH